MKIVRSLDLYWHLYTYYLENIHSDVIIRHTQSWACYFKYYIYYSSLLPTVTKSVIYYSTIGETGYGCNTGWVVTPPIPPIRDKIWAMWHLQSPPPAIRITHGNLQVVSTIFPGVREKSKFWGKKVTLFFFKCLFSSTFTVVDIDCIYKVVDRVVWVISGQTIVSLVKNGVSLPC